MLNDTKGPKKQEEESERKKNKKNSNDNNNKNKTTTKKKKHKRNTKEKLSDNTVNRRRPGRKMTQPEGCIPTPEGDGAALEEVSGCISRLYTRGYLVEISRNSMILYDERLTYISTC